MKIRGFGRKTGDDSRRDRGIFQSMPHLGPALSRRLTRRTCLVCGHQGRRLQGPTGLTATRCPHCNADLYARPPRSYAEMEGLVDVSPVAEYWTKPTRREIDAGVADDPVGVTVLRLVLIAGSVIFLLGLGAASALLLF